MTLCWCACCAGSSSTASACDVEFPTFNCETCGLGGCTTCDDSSYRFPSYGATAIFQHCFSCQQLNCAAGGCSDDVGAFANSMSWPLSLCSCNESETTDAACQRQQMMDKALSMRAGCTSCPQGFQLSPVRCSQ